MFAAHCPKHGTEILLGYRRLIGVANTADGIDVHLLCYCGEHLVQHTGGGPAKVASVAC
jgi:hypothetical protein